MHSSSRLVPGPGPFYYDSAVRAITSTARLSTGLTLSYSDQGDRSGPVLLLLPGPTDSWRSYEPVLDAMTMSIRTIAVSQRGHGDSDKPMGGYQVEDFAADVVPLLDALGIERSVLAGHSGSCLVARRVAIDRPERIAGLILEASPTTLQCHPGLEAFVESVVAGLQDPVDRAFARSFVVNTSSEHVAALMLDHLVDELLKVPARVWREMFAGLLDYDDMGELGRVAAPTMLIWGDADELVTREMQDQLIACIPGAQLVVYPDIGHTPRWEDAPRFASDVAAFVERSTLA